MTADGNPIGAHTRRVGGGDPATSARIAAIGAEVVQIFSSNPRAWVSPTGLARDAEADGAFAAFCARRGTALVMHAPYLVNLASATPSVVEKSVAALAYALARGRMMGVRGVVFHAGSVGRDGDPVAGRFQVSRALRPLLDALPDDAPDLLVEPTAGGGGSVAATVAELAAYLDAMQWHPRLRICLDTCHLHAAGHDLATVDGMGRMLDDVRARCGDRVGLVHANDSKGACGSRLDRHAGIGLGTIGEDPFGVLFTHPVTRGEPVVVETPDDDNGQARDLDTLRRLRDGSEPAATRVRVPEPVL